MSDIFISYARQNLDKVRPIAEALEAHGWEVWWDPKIRSGSQFERVIKDALANTRCVLVVWSKASVDSDRVCAEASYGLKNGNMISIVIERDVSVPIRFLNIHTEPLIDWDGEMPSAAFDKIVRDFEARLGSPKLLDKQIEHSDLDTMVEIPAGEFIYQEGEAIIKNPYLIDVYPVTNQQFEKYIKAGGYQKNQYWSDEGLQWREAQRITLPLYWTEKKLNQPEQPVLGVSYHEAEAYSKWADKKLPTEQEWERAARGTDGRIYPWGNDFDSEMCNTSESCAGNTTLVTRYPNGISPAGCYDMVGNVYEWTTSWYDEEKNLKTVRGGSWGHTRKSAQCAFRFSFSPSAQSYGIGFRCVRTLV